MHHKEVTPVIYHAIRRSYRSLSPLALLFAAGYHMFCHWRIYCQGCRKVELCFCGYLAWLVGFFLFLSSFFCEASNRIIQVGKDHQDRVVQPSAHPQQCRAQTRREIMNRVYLSVGLGCGQPWVGIRGCHPHGLSLQHIIEP